MLADEGPLLSADRAARIELSGLVLDGADHSVGGDRGLIDFSNLGEAEIFDCVIERSGGFGLRLRACGGWRAQRDPRYRRRRHFYHRCDGPGYRR